MSLNISNVSNQNNIYKRNQNSGSVKFGMLNNTEKFSKSNDGQFSTSEAAKNFAKGIISPITGMFSSVKNFLAGSVVVGASAALIIATGGVAAPLLVTTGLAMGAFQAGKAVYKIKKAKDGDELEKAFFDVGGATSAIGLSLIGAKSSLSQAGMSVEKLNPLTAALKSIKMFKAFAVDCASAFKSGFYKVNITDFIKKYEYPVILRQMAKELRQEGKIKSLEAVNEVKSIFPESYHNSIKVRTKGERSIWDKLVNAYKNVKDAILDKNAAKAEIDDLIGTRLNLEDTSPAHIKKIVNYLVDAIRNDKIVITEIKNYRGKNGKFYFTDDQVKAVQIVSREKGIDTFVNKNADRIKETGYTAVQLKFKHKNGAMGELQIRGSEIDKVSSWEHLPYDLRMDKYVYKFDNAVGKLLLPIKKAIDKLSKSDFKEYSNYTAACYKHARMVEMGKKPTPPVLPDKFDKILSAENLSKLSKEVSQLPERKKISFEFQPVTAFYSGVSSKLNPPENT